MKKINYYLSFLAIVCLLFTSCSKDEVNGGSENDPDAKSTLTFGVVLEDLTTNRTSKNHLSDFPVCSDEEPDYVEIVLSQDGSDILGTMEAPFRIDLVDGQLFTEDIPELQLLAGIYSLDYFAVYDSGDNLIWIAPKTGGSLANFVDNPLSIPIDLRNGVKKYVDVTVICFDDRLVNEYGFLFFEINPEIAIEFCVFGNYCDETGRHFPAKFRLDVWNYENGQIGSPLFLDLENTVVLNDAGDYAGSPLCVALPDIGGDQVLDEYYFEITLLNSDAYGPVTEQIIRQGVVNDNEVRNLFDGDNNLDYYHFKEGCDSDDDPPILDDPNDDVISYKACLLPLNDSKVVGFAYFQLEGNKLDATILAANMVPNEMHPQHIHGKEDKSNATCPPEDARDDDPNDNPNFLSVAEGLPFYGGILVSLEEGGPNNFPVANEFGFLNYQESFTLGGSLPTAGDLNPLVNRAVVLHGLKINGVYEASRPVSCGEIKLIN